MLLSSIVSMVVVLCCCCWHKRAFGSIEAIIFLSPIRTFYPFDHEGRFVHLSEQQIECLSRSWLSPSCAPSPSLLKSHRHHRHRGPAIHLFLCCFFAPHLHYTPIARTPHEDPLGGELGQTTKKLSCLLLRVRYLTVVCALNFFLLPSLLPSTHSKEKNSPSSTVVVLRVVAEECSLVGHSRSASFSHCQQAQTASSSKARCVLGVLHCAFSTLLFHYYPLRAPFFFFFSFFICLNRKPVPTTTFLFSVFPPSLSLHLHHHFSSRVEEVHHF